MQSHVNAYEGQACTVQLLQTWLLSMLYMPCNNNCNGKHEMSTLLNTCSGTSHKDMHAAPLLASNFTTIEVLAGDSTKVLLYVGGPAAEGGVDDSA